MFVDPSRRKFLIYLLQIKGEDAPQISPLDPLMGSGDTPETPVIDEMQNEKDNINAFVVERTPTECEG